MIGLEDACRGWAAAFCDVQVPEERLRSFVTSGVAHFLRVDAAQPDGRISDEMREDVRRAAALAGEIGILHPTALAEGTVAPPALTTLNCLTAWARQAPPREVPLAELAPRLLASAIAEVAAAGEAAFSTPAGIESLLRQVEVRRFSTAALDARRTHAECARLLAADVATCLARYARRCADVRVLNAAFKINDREFARHQRLPVRPSTTRYLLAIAEQEHAAQELLS